MLMWPVWFKASVSGVTGQYGVSQQQHYGHFGPGNSFWGVGGCWSVHCRHLAVFLASTHQVPIAPFTCDHQNCFQTLSVVLQEGGGKIVPWLKTTELAVCIPTTRTMVFVVDLFLLLFLREKLLIWMKKLVVLSCGFRPQNCDGFSFKCQITQAGLRVSFNDMCQRKGSKIRHRCIFYSFYLFIGLLIMVIFLKGRSSWHTAIDLTKFPFQHLLASNSLIVDILPLVACS